MKTPIPALLAAIVLAACQPADEPAAVAAPADAGPAAAEAQAAPVEPAAPAGPAETGMPSHPSLVVETLDDGPFDLAQQRGQWVVVNFWATWCKPCLKEIPDLSAFDTERDDVRVIGLAYEEIEPDDMRAFLEKHPASYPIALLDVYDPPADFETPRGLPMTYLVDPEGKVAKKYLGPITSQELAADIAAIAGEA
jgi:thiol-disulfide isomerase/thioredoxin